MTTPSQPMEGDTLTALAKRLEAATGPDRELDGLLHCEIVENADVRRDGKMLIARSRTAPFHEWVVFGGRPPEPHYTASLDAALALVGRKLPGWDYVLTNRGRKSTEPFVLLSFAGSTVGATVPDKMFTANGATLPLAVLLALITALQQERPNE